MATYWTWAQIKAKVEFDLDLQDEIFIQPQELSGYGNEAIDEAEAEIHAIYEDYFLTSAPLDLQTGISEYPLPTDIYAHKIRGIIYSSGGITFQIPRIRDWNKFIKMALEMQYPATTTYSYIIKNASALIGPRIILFPPARETSSSVATLWYLRNANRIVDDDSICDIPEFVSFVIQFIKVRCYEKEGHPNLQFATLALQKQRELMIETLTDMIPDGDNNVEMDLTSYEEMN